MSTRSNSTEVATIEPTVDPPRRPSRPAYVIIGIFVTICAVGWGIVMAYAKGSPGVVGQTISFHVTGDSVVILRYEVIKPKSARVRCVLRAMDINHAEVAHMEITIPTDTGHVVRTQRLTTSARATSADITGCRSN